MEFIERGSILRVLFDVQLNSLICSTIEHDLEERISEAKKRTPNLEIEFDLTQTEFICSTFLRFCVFYAKQLGHGKFRILNPMPNVLHVFVISGLSGVVDLVSPGNRINPPA